MRRPRRIEPSTTGWRQRAVAALVRVRVPVRHLFDPHSHECSYISRRMRIVRFPRDAMHATLHVK